MKTRGFITVATGVDVYFHDALNLLHSYRLFSENPLPFAILCDQENEFTKEFDLTIKTENAVHGFLDKFLLAEHIPFDEMIFIEPDVLIYGDINYFFELFSGATDFSCFGRFADKDAKGFGYFQKDLLPEDIGERVTQTIGLHGGLFYIRNSERAKKVLNDARQLSQRYADFHFIANGEYLSDEPLLALSMSINKCLPIPFSNTSFAFYPRNIGQLKLNMRKKYAKYSKSNQKLQALHWGSRFTKLPLYKKEEYFLNCHIGIEKYSFMKVIKLNMALRGYRISRLKARIIEFAVKTKHKILK